MRDAGRVTARGRGCISPSIVAWDIASSLFGRGAGHESSVIPARPARCRGQLPHRNYLPAGAALTETPRPARFAVAPDRLMRYRAGMVPRLVLLALGKIVGFPSRMRLWQFHAA